MKKSIVAAALLAMGLFVGTIHAQEAGVNPLRETPTAPAGVVKELYTDVPISHWAAPYIYEGLRQGMNIAGCEDGKFCPDTPVTRAQLMVLFYLLRGTGMPTLCMDPAYVNSNGYGLFEYTGSLAVEGTNCPEKKQ